MAHQESPSPRDYTLLALKVALFSLNARKEKVAGETRSTYIKSYFYAPGFVQLHLEKEQARSRAQMARDL